MNLERVEQIAKAVLYEGYMLYPYRPSSVKNRLRFNFGVLYPKAYSDSRGGDDPVSVHTECLIRGTAETLLETRLRFLQLRTRFASHPTPTTANPFLEGWQDAVEREAMLPAYRLGGLCLAAAKGEFLFGADVHAEPGAPAIKPESNPEACGQAAVCAEVTVAATEVQGGIYRLTVDVLNTTHFESASDSRDEALLASLVSTHTVLGVSDGDFISLLEPPEDLQALTAQCKNVGAWPVLVGDEGATDTLLVSPIVLYDYPQIAPESAGDLFDGTEIDEILSLRIMTLSDEEKREIRESDERARQILERTESMPAEQFMKLHGVLRGLRPANGEGA